MTPEVFAYLVVPGAIIGVALIGYAVIVWTEPKRSRKRLASPIADASAGKSGR